ncbi:hypothetical protein APS67_001836 [Streptomyces sp. AVP053U2]|nr:hypothetical protein APS67_001836 [Streptomyces sp. AVP053U2]
MQPARAAEATDTVVPVLSRLVTTPAAAGRHAAGRPRWPRRRRGRRRQAPGGRAATRPAPAAAAWAIEAAALTGARHEPSRSPCDVRASAGVLERTTGRRPGSPSVPPRHEPWRGPGDRGGRAAHTEGPRRSRRWPPSPPPSSRTARQPCPDRGRAAVGGPPCARTGSDGPGPRVASPASAAGSASGAGGRSRGQDASHERFQTLAAVRVGAAGRTRRRGTTGPRTVRTRWGRRCPALTVGGEGGAGGRFRLGRRWGGRWSRRRRPRRAGRRLCRRRTAGVRELGVAAQVARSWTPVTVGFPAGRAGRPRGRARGAHGGERRHGRRRWR